MARRKCNIGLIVLAILSGLMGQSSSAAAHPHAWIDLETRLVVAEPGSLSAIELEWLFDEFYTAFVANDFAKDERIGRMSGKEILLELAGINLTSLKEYDYFTEVRADGKPVRTGVVKQFETGMRGQRIWLRFTLPLLDPLPIGGQDVHIRVYDPSYYIEVLYRDSDAAHIEGPGTEDCEMSIIPAHPTMEQVFLAGAIDRDATAPENLGRLFAETLRLSCP